MSSFANYIDKHKDFVCPSGKIKSIRFTQDDTDSASKKYVNDTVNAFGGVDNPMIVDLDGADYEITNVKKFTANDGGFLSQNGGYITVNGNIYSSTGTITADSGNITSNTGEFISGAGNYTALSGDFVANTGNFTTNSGNITTNSGNFQADSGDFTTNSGNIGTIGGNISANQVLINGVANTVSAAGGFSTNAGDYDTSSGNIQTNSGNVTTFSGDINTATGDISCANGTMACSVAEISTSIDTLTDLAVDIGSNSNRMRDIHMRRVFYYDSGLSTDSSSRHIALAPNEAMSFNTGGSTFSFSANPSVFIPGVISDGFRYVINSNTDKAFRPGRNNTSNLGTASNRWKAVYAVNGVIQTSNRDSKKNITPCKMGLDFLNKLKPRMYHYKEENDSDIKRCGLIWEELNEVAPNFRGLHKNEFFNDETGETDQGYGIAYDQFIIPLIAGTQELYAENVSLKSQLASQRKMIDDLQLQINQIKLKI